MAGLAVAEKREEMVEAEILSYLQQHDETVPPSNVLRDLQKDISEKEIMQALRFLLQSGRVRMGPHMNLEVVE
ncbi:hypothetical protein [Pelagibius sp.]|uniref:hypothetical protein n=1 Tax=Pelagibius sp. TaxID=1931238 RepID=UPI003BAFB65B